MSIANLDRGIGKYILDRVIEEGFALDKTRYDPEDPRAIDDYMSALKDLRAILAEKGDCIIEVYGVGSWEDRDAKTDSRIVINRKDITRGSIGSKHVVEYQEVLDNENELVGYEKYALPESTFDIEYEVRVISTSSAHEVRMTEWIMDLFDNRTFIVGVDEEFRNIENEVYTIFEKGSVDMTNREFNERMFMFEARDVYVKDFKLLSNNIVPLTQIIAVKKGLDSPLQDNGTDEVTTIIE